MQDALRELIVRYCDNLAQQVSEVSGLLDALEAGTGDGADITRALDLTHQMAGLSGSMGYPAVSTAAALLEKHLRTHDEVGRLPDPSELALVRAQFSQLQGLAAEVEPEGSALFNVDLSQFAKAIG